MVSPGDVEPGMLTKMFLKLKQLLRLDKKKSTEKKEDEIIEEDQDTTAMDDDNKEKAD